MWHRHRVRVARMRVGLVIVWDGHAGWVGVVGWVLGEGGGVGGVVGAAIVVVVR